MSPVTWDQVLAWRMRRQYVEQAEGASALDAALTREELTRAVVDRTGSQHLADVLGSGWGTLLKPLAWWGVLCYGPPQGSKVTFTSPARWLPGWAGLPAVEDAARTVIHACLGAHGPATADALTMIV
ncbi:crosslink repair DNA glycosylase YcaQ family protein [Actinomadura sp. B10D3]|uniref:DNA glycosylase AlkZ-like family protein n=1 Tax=Actinomadura sp. B10D3 TaxID=3153557 RepID=UPI00325D4BC9